MGLRRADYLPKFPAKIKPIGEQWRKPIFAMCDWTVCSISLHEFVFCSCKKSQLIQMYLVAVIIYVNDLNLHITRTWYKLISRSNHLRQWKKKKNYSILERLQLKFNLNFSRLSALYPRHFIKENAKNVTGSLFQNAHPCNNLLIYCFCGHFRNKLPLSFANRPRKLGHFIEPCVKFISEVPAKTVH